MNEKLKCTICGFLISVFLISNTPICNRCLAHTKENPHTSEVYYSVGPMERVTVSGIASTAIAFDLEKYQVIERELEGYRRKEKLLKGLRNFEDLAKWGRGFAKKKNITQRQVLEND